MRKSCAELSRIGIADVVIGELLASAQIGRTAPGLGGGENRDGRSPIRGYDARSTYRRVQLTRVHTRGPGGDQERQLADKYRKWAQQLRTSSPYVASELLMKLTDTYEREAAREDTEARINQRLRC